MSKRRSTTGNTGATHSWSMAEPQLGRFRELIRAGAGTLDIHDGQTGSPFTREAQADAALIEREVARVDLHLHSICPLLAHCVGALGEVLDVGCGTGATTVALALSAPLHVGAVVGIDPNRKSLEAAEVRAAGYGLNPPRVRFEAVEAGDRIPYADDRFDLTLCVSVIEYIASEHERARFAAELLRVTKPGGSVCLVTPSPYRLRAYHTHRLFGDWRRTEGYPWASSRSGLRKLFPGQESRFLDGEQFELGLGRRGVRGGRLLRVLAPLARFLAWQKLLVTKRMPADAGAPHS